VGTQIRFWKDPYKNEAKSAEAGIPVFDTVDWYEIRVLGESDTIQGPWRLASAENKERWAKAHAEWMRDNSTEGIIGTPLSEVAWLARGEVETFKYSGIRTLENLAEVADNSITRIPGGLAYRQKARDMLAAAKSSSHMQQMSEELAKRDAEIDALRDAIAALGGKLPEAPKRRGRPPKAQASEA
jgi:hypothetical protein